MARSAEAVGWAILELMGHRKLAGYVQAVELAGASFVRIDVPNDKTDLSAVVPDGPWEATQFYSPSAVYCVTPTTAELAARFARTCRPAPVARWELPALPEREEQSLGLQTYMGDDGDE